MMNECFEAQNSYITYRFERTGIVPSYFLTITYAMMISICFSLYNREIFCSNVIYIYTTKINHV